MELAIPDLLSAEHSLGVFLLVSVAMGGGAAWLAGRAIAATWRPWWHVVLYMLILSLAVRFIHFALFDSILLSLHYYLVDFAVVWGSAWLPARCGYRRPATAGSMSAPAPSAGAAATLRPPRTGQIRDICGFCRLNLAVMWLASRANDYKPPRFHPEEPP